MPTSYTVTLNARQNAGLVWRAEKENMLPEDLLNREAIRVCRQYYKEMDAIEMQKILAVLPDKPETYDQIKAILGL